MEFENLESLLLGFLNSNQPDLIESARFSINLLAKQMLTKILPTETHKFYNNLGELTSNQECFSNNIDKVKNLLVILVEFSRYRSVAQDLLQIP